ncbi:hypothetical protein SH661x_000993 [Planctomicrobium sp. SH661]|uniref:hypothetical protein n=1 Tax=Planctomicrobium sp. SH661 TaxID=3448124 RepID=UPI003F5BDC70
MTKIAKILAVFVAVTSLAFAGFAVATTFGGPDWVAMTRAPYFHHYNFVSGTAPDFVWTAARVSDGAQVASSKRLPDVLIKVMDDILQRQQAELQNLNDREPQLTTRVETLTKAKAEDEKALVAYEKAQRERLAAVRLQNEQIAKEVIAATNEVQKIENQIALRREDVQALKRQADELKADQFRLQEVQKNLESLLIQLEGDRQRADLREQGLQAELP